jgi:hypothetical protein
LSPPPAPFTGQIGLSYKDSRAARSSIFNESSLRLESCRAALTFYGSDRDASRANSELGRASDFARPEAAGISDFDDKANEFLRRPDRFNSSYEYIFQRARSVGIDSVIVIMPMSPYHLARFYSLESWARFRAASIHLASERGIRVSDASDWLPRKGF